MAENNRSPSLAAERRLTINKPSNVEVDEKFTDSQLQDVTSVQLSYCVELAKAKDIHDFRQKILQIVNRLGFSDFTYMRLTGGDFDPQFLVTVPEEILTIYEDEGFYENDMILSYGSHNVKPIYWSEINDYMSRAPFECDLTRTAHGIYALNKSYDYYDFYNIPFRASNGDGNSMFSITSKGFSPLEFRRKVKGCESTFQLLAEAVDLIATRKFPELMGGMRDVKQKINVVINPKPLRVLETLANNDLNIGQVADKLFISVVTANKHLETARKAFDVNTNYAAIRKAISLGLIEYES